jgi:hypothetical protein
LRVAGTAWPRSSDRGASGESCCQPNPRLTTEATMESRSVALRVEDLELVNSQIERHPPPTY